MQRWWCGVSNERATKRYFVEMDFDSRQSIYFTANSTDFDLFLAWFAIKAHKFHCSMQWLIPQLFALCIAFVGWLAGLSTWLPASHPFIHLLLSIDACDFMRPRHSTELGNQTASRTTRKMHQKLIDVLWMQFQVCCTNICCRRCSVTIAEWISTCGDCVWECVCANCQLKWTRQWN